jgi:hypothetical protein
MFFCKAICSVLAMFWRAAQMVASTRQSGGVQASIGFGRPTA